MFIYICMQCWCPSKSLVLIEEGSQYCQHFNFDEDILVNDDLLSLNVKHTWLEEKNKFKKRFYSRILVMIHFQREFESYHAMEAF